MVPGERIPTIGAWAGKASPVRMLGPQTFLKKSVEGMNPLRKEGRSPEGRPFVPPSWYIGDRTMTPARTLMRMAVHNATNR